MATDLKDTLLLPKTDFPMRANLVQREPARLAHWEQLGLYERIQQQRAGAPAFVLHDGPPFTNGDVHIGTALNKTLKDIVNRYKSMRGFRTPFVPGWDCHGLPIEQKVSREIKEQNLTLSTAEMRAKCDAFSEVWIAKQTAQFKRLGVLADWKSQYKTKTPAFEADVLRTFAAFVEQGLVYRSKKPVYWSPDAVKRVTGKTLSGIAENGIIHLINSGSTTLDATAQQRDKDGNPAMKPFWEITEDEVQLCLDNTTWPQAVREYFRGGGYSSQFNTAGQMPVTMSRINIIKGQGPVLQMAEGWTVELPDDIHQILTDRTDPSWPTTWFVPRLNEKDNFKDVYAVMANWGANHGAISYGHIGADLITLASMLRIPVCMHNVPNEKIFRPNAWSGFGEEKTSADFLACKNYGSLYGI